MLLTKPLNTFFRYTLGRRGWKPFLAAWRRRLRGSEGGSYSRGCFVYALSVALSVSLAPLSLSPPPPSLSPSLTIGLSCDKPWGDEGGSQFLRRLLASSQPPACTYTSAYVSIRQHTFTAAFSFFSTACVHIYVSIRQHSSAYFYGGLQLLLNRLRVEV